MNHNSGRVAALVAFIWSAVLCAWIVLAALLSGVDDSDPVLIPLLLLPLVVTAAGAFISGTNRTRFMVRITATALLAIYILFFFVLGFYFIPALIASGVAAVQARPRGGARRLGVTLNSGCVSPDHGTGNELSA